MVRLGLAFGLRLGFRVKDYFFRFSPWVRVSEYGLGLGLGVGVGG